MWLYFELNENEERRGEYRELLGLHALGLKKSAEHLLRSLQLMMAAAPKDGHFCHGVVFALARHVAGEVDALAVLVESGCVEPSQSHLRSAFEADLGIRYIQQADCERRALAYHVKEARDRLRANQKYDDSTQAGREIRDQLKSDKIASEILASLPPYDFDSENKRLKAMLSRHPYDAIDKEWQSIKKKTGRHPAWHALFGGPKTIRDLAFSLGRGFWYEFLYSGWSGHIHAGSVLKNFGTDSSDPAGLSKAIKPLRHPDGLQDVYNFGINLCSMLAHDMAQRYLSSIGRDDVRRFYMEEIRPINEQVSAVKIEAKWK